ncbi:MAG TPA: hypothetical protein VEH84_14635 [Alphaproteobacteria bacterium]|nr:hypothetical protein [Alphaproteobacteria bacterium]
MAKTADLTDLIQALERQSRETETFARRGRAADDSIQHQIYDGLKQRVLQFEMLYDIVVKRLDVLPPDKMQEVAAHLTNLRGVVAGLYFDQAFKWLCLLSSRRSVPLGLADRMQRELKTLTEYRDRTTRIASALRFDLIEPTYLPFLEDMVMEISMFAPGMKSFDKG